MASERPSAARSSLGARVVLSIALVGAVALALFFGLWAPRQRAQALQEWRARLTAMAEDRRAFVESWVREGLAAASLPATYPTATHLAGGRRGPPFPYPVEQGAAGHLRQLLTELVARHGLTACYLLDETGRELASSGGAALADGEIRQAVRAAAGGAGPVVELIGPGEEARGLFAVAVARSSPPAAVVAVVDPGHSLFPALRQDPLLTRSGETVLVRHDDAEHVVLISPLRHRPTGAGLRVPGSQVSGPSPAPGAQQAGAFADYTGRRVLAVTRRVPIVSWDLVAKIDEDEALARWRRDMRQAGLAALSLYLALVGIGYGAWRRQRAAYQLELSRQESRLGLALEQANDVVFIVRRDGTVLDVRGGVEKLYGWRPEELLGRHAADFRVPEERDRALANMERIAAEGSLVFGSLHRRKDGSDVPVEISARLIRHGGEDLFFAIARDVSQRQATEGALRASEERFRRLAENAPVVIYRMRLVPEIAFEYVSPAAETVAGYTPDEFYADPDLARRIVHPDDRKLLAPLVRGEPPAGPVEFRSLRKDGSLVWTEHRLSPIRDASGRVVALEGLVLDVTARKRAEETLQQTQRQLLQAQKIEAVGRLAGGVAHDFNNLLNVITGYAEMLGRQLGADHPGRPRLDQILKAADRAATVTRQLLAFSRRQVLQPRVVDLNAAVADLEKTLLRLIGEDVELTTRLAPGLGSVKVDLSQLEQVIMNLAVNARDAMPRGGRLTIETAEVDFDVPYTLTHEPARPGPYVMLAVADTGIGMDAELRSHIFEPFFTTKPAGKGTGLGLATVYGIVKQSGGYVWVYSEPGQGTTFKIYLPRVDARPERAAAAAAPVQLARGDETVLLVEDQTDVRELAREALSELGYKVLVAAGVEEARNLEQACREPIHLLLTDVVMPRASGRQIAEELLPRRPGLRVLYMSGYTSDIVAAHGVLEAGVHLLEKPFTMLALARKVREVLDEAGPPGTAPPG
jgi:PAS domain S-box-containing protein